MSEIRRRVALSCTANPAYAFVLPITCRLWRRLGYEPIVVLVGDQAGWLKQTLAAVENGSDSIFWQPSIEGFEDSTVAQVSRLAAWMLAGSGQYILTADADMWPLSRQYFGWHTEGCKLDLYSWNAYAHEKEFKQPICYIGAMRAIWSEICLGWRDFEAAIRWMLSACGEAADGWEQWNLDETWISEAIHSWSGFSDACRARHRGILPFWTGGPGSAVVGRIDRAAWPKPGEAIPDACIDAHLPHNAWEDEPWAGCAAILAKDLPTRPAGGWPAGQAGGGEEITSWAEQYRSAWLSRMESGTPAIA